jgi:trehalose 6-phosphate synthase/phosphatase
MSEPSDGVIYRVHFRVECGTRLGQAIGIGGSTNSLGSYEKDKVVQLVTTPDSYPLWYSENPVLIQRESEVTYKYCIIEGGKCIAFENSPRILTMNDASDDVLVEDKFDIHSLDDVATHSEAQLLKEIENLKNIHQKSVDDMNHLKINDSKVIIVCYHLPVIITRTPNSDLPFSVEWAESLIAKSKNSVSTSVQTFWYGTVDISGQELSAFEETELRSILEEMNCYPIFIDREVTLNAYLGYCKQILWPVFHNIDQLDQIHAAWNLNKVIHTNDSSVYDSSDCLNWNEDLSVYMESYKTVNETFFNNLKPIVKKGDIVWVHDYHLMLLPKFLRESMELDSPYSIVFFLHLPFPTSQVSLNISFTDYLTVFYFKYKDISNSTKRI